MSGVDLTHPVRLVLMAGCTFVLGVAFSPWFWVLALLFLVVWGVGFLKWVLA